MQPSLFVYERFVNRPKNFYYFNYDGFEYRFDKRNGTFVRADGAKFYKSETHTKPLLLAMAAQQKIDGAKTHAEKIKFIHAANALKLSPEEKQKRLDEYKVRKRKVAEDTRPPVDVVKRNEISWTNHFLAVKETKTRVTSRGIEIRVGNMIITVRDPEKVEAVRKRFEEHELNKFKKL